MLDRKVQRTYYIKVSQDEKLHELLSKTEVPTSVRVREGIDLVLDKYRDDWHNQKYLPLD